MNYSLAKIASLTGGSLTGNNSNHLIRYLVTDSRHLGSTEDSLFFALEGKRYDGHDFIPELYGKGYRAFLVRKLPSQLTDLQDADFILVEDTLKALQDLAGWHRKLFQYPVIGITGSNGKTIVKEWLFQLLKNKYLIIRSPKSYNSQVGVPLSVWQMSNAHSLAIFEAGISEAGEMQRLEKIISPTIGIFTNIGQSHQENFESIEQKINEKLHLFRNCKTLIYCRDHHLLHDNILKDSTLLKVHKFSWSFSGEGDLRITQQQKQGATYFKALFGKLNFEFSIPFSNKVSVENAMHCFALMVHLGLSPEAVSEVMTSLSQVEMRLELKKGINDCTLINDSYNSDMGSLEVALDFLNQLNKHRKKTLILSDIFQSGLNESDLYTEVSQLVKKKKITHFIGIGHALLNQKNLFPEGSAFFSGTDEFLNSFKEYSFQNEAILIKGSRDFAFERITALLEQKVHQTVMEINLSALVHNLNHYKAMLKPGIKLAVVVKAFSYGIGSWEIANLMQYHRVDYLAVAFTQEGVSLRKAGITLPIMVMNPDENSAGLMIDHQLEPEIYNFHHLQLFIDELEKRGLSNYPVHLKIDTGMHRLGFMPTEIEELLQWLRNQSFVHLKSVFSHLAASDEPEHDVFTRNQIAAFSGICDRMKSELGVSFIRHILNSGGIERFPDAQFDMVRLGIGLYGVSGLKHNKLMTVATLKSSVSQVKKISAGGTIGYSRMGNPGKESTIAIVPVGYADGLDRRLGNGHGKMLVNGTFFPTIGNICMDMCMLDVTGATVKEGDEVIVFGEDYTISDMAADLNTIPYEVLSSISARVKRIYLQE
jgi:Alr-MurF fusion protein